MRIGMVGLGRMGGNMVTRLIRGGHEVVAYTRDRSKVQKGPVIGAVVNVASFLAGIAPATVYGAALAPGSAGLYHVAIQVPSTLADGDWPIQASIGGVTPPAGVVLSIAH